jgi:hypothetical protein
LPFRNRKLQPPVRASWRKADQRKDGPHESPIPFTAAIALPAATAVFAAKRHRRMARNEAAENAREAEITRRLNREQAGLAKSGARTP